MKKTFVIFAIILTVEGHEQKCVHSSDKNGINTNPKEQFYTMTIEALSVSKQTIKTGLHNNFVTRFGIELCL